MVKMLRTPEGIIAKAGAILAVLAVVLAAGCGSVVGAKEVAVKPVSPTAASSNSSVTTGTSQRSSTTTPLACTTSSSTVFCGNDLPELRTIEMTTATNGWAWGSDVILRTDDGGQEWTDVSPTTKNCGSFYATHFSSSGAGWTTAQCGSQTDFFTTPNGGLSWSTHPMAGVTGHAISISFVSPETGWLLTSLGVAMGSDWTDLYKTTNGGNTWVLLASNGSPNNGSGRTQGFVPVVGDKTSMVFTTKTTGWITGASDSVGSPYFYETTNGGASWTIQSLPLPRRALAINVVIEAAPVFFSSSVGVLPVQFGDYCIVFRTTNGGGTWEAGSSITSQSPLFSFDAATTGWIASNAQQDVIWTTGNAGQTWDQTTSSGLPRPPVAISFVNDSLGFAVVQNSSSLLQQMSVWSTDDGGTSWHSIANR